MQEIKSFINSLIVRLRWALCFHAPRILYSDVDPFVECSKCHKVFINNQQNNESNKH